MTWASPRSRMRKGRESGSDWQSDAMSLTGAQSKAGRRGSAERLREVPSPRLCRNRKDGLFYQPAAAIPAEQSLKCSCQCNSHHSLNHTWDSKRKKMLRTEHSLCIPAPPLKYVFVFSVYSAGSSVTAQTPQALSPPSVGNPPSL